MTTNWRKLSPIVPAHLSLFDHGREKYKLYAPIYNDVVAS